MLELNAVWCYWPSGVRASRHFILPFIDKICYLNVRLESITKPFPKNYDQWIHVSSLEEFQDLAANVIFLFYGDVSETGLSTLSSSYPDH